MSMSSKLFSAVPVGPQPDPRPCPECGILVPAWWKLTHWAEGGPCEACLDAAESKQRQAKETARNAEAFQARLAASGLEPKHLNMTFASWPGDICTRTRLEEWTRNPNCNLMLTGPTGCGKSGGLASIANEAVKTRCVRFIRSVDLIKELRRAEIGDGERAAEWIEDLVNTPSLLLIDDLGKERATVFVEEALFNLFDLIELKERHGVAFSTNFTLKELGERLGEAVASRIGGNFEPIIITGTDLRLE